MPLTDARRRGQRRRGCDLLAAVNLSFPAPKETGGLARGISRE
jgi:hypothetical protein